MTDTAIDPPENLAAAEGRFSRFLQDNGHPPNVQWVVGGNIVFDNEHRCCIRADYTRADLAEAK